MGSSPPGSFVLKVTPELMLKIATEQDFDGRRKVSGRRHKKKEQQQQSPKKLVPELGQALPPSNPYVPGPFTPPSLPAAVRGSVLNSTPPYHPTSPPVQKDATLDAHARKIADYSALLERTEKLVTELQKQGAAELDEINRRTQELISKQYKVPIRSIPCIPEREACLQCYKENASEPLKCKQTADAFLECARRAQKELASTIL